MNLFQDDLFSKKTNSNDPEQEKDPDYNADDERFNDYEEAADAAALDRVRKRKTTITNNEGPSKKKGRGPNKAIRVTELMRPEYNAKGQPCGKWQRKYGKHLGVCMRKISILHSSWKEVLEGLKKSLWEDTMVKLAFAHIFTFLAYECPLMFLVLQNLFHIEPTTEKRDVFFSAVAERFRDFKSKLVSGWITKTRDTSCKAKRKRQQQIRQIESAEEADQQPEQPEEDQLAEQQPEAQPEEADQQADQQPEAAEPQPTDVMPYEKYGHITKEDWETFLKEQTSEKRAISANSVNFFSFTIWLWKWYFRFFSLILFSFMLHL